MQHINRKFFRRALLVIAITAMTAGPANAISSRYRAQLERSGCTQVTEAQGCDIHKTKAQNRAAGFHDGVAPTKHDDLKPFTGEYIARHKDGQRVASIHIGAGTARMNGKPIKATVVGDMLIINGSKTLTYVIYKEKGSYWEDTDAGNRGPIEHVYY
ncbi:hypothetical protein UXN85_20630 [Enterobacter hormaechei]